MTGPKRDFKGWSGEDNKKAERGALWTKGSSEEGDGTVKGEGIN